MPRSLGTSYQSTQLRHCRKALTTSSKTKSWAPIFPRSLFPPVRKAASWLSTKVIQHPPSQYLYYSASSYPIISHNYLAQASHSPVSTFARCPGWLPSIWCAHYSYGRSCSPSGLQRHGLSARHGVWHSTGINSYAHRFH